MVKYCIDKYPKGTLKKQVSDGRYMDGYLHQNLDVLAKAIVNDMTFLGVLYSSTLEVGTGKSTLAQHVGEAYTEMVNKKHGLNLEFTTKNIVFKPQDLIKRSFELPKYSCIVLDEWEDAHFFSELGKALRTFFRKCRQLNLFMLIIIPNFFQLPIGYAITRSAFAIDVKFHNEFQRGYFSFYNFDRKKDLYLKGKKTYNYHCVPANFNGRFTEGYAVDENEYREAKHKDMVESEEKEQRPKDKNFWFAQVIRQMLKHKPNMSYLELSKHIGVTDKTIKKIIDTYIKVEGDGEETGGFSDGNTNINTINPIGYG